MPAPLIYGATGYTGRLIAREAVRRGMRPIVAGRTAASVAALAAELGCPSRTVAIDAVDALVPALADCGAVLNCAGPFSRTAAPMLEACLRARVPYLDITGEIDAIEHAARRHAAAIEAGIPVLPAVGFDVVPSDCLARHLAEALPTATHLTLAFTGTGTLSPGTTKTMLEQLPRGGRARVNGQIVRVPSLWKTRAIPFRTGVRSAVTIPWGDVASAYHTTGIANIEVYMAPGRAQWRQMRAGRWLAPLLRFGVLRRIAQRHIEKTIFGPNAAELATSRASLWGEVADQAGRRLSATLETPGGYPLTVAAALAVLERVLAGRAPAGFGTPARTFGKNLVVELPGVELHGPA